ncbi:MAG: UbiD family decarboxylase [Deltaproteobacteria bacterium]|nr:MAG: UbiD family decarboxylase [Deltaproteobacteria bacterium]
MSMAVRDLREFVALLEQHEEIQRVQEEVDWNLEMGAIIRRCYDIGGPAVLFENVRDYPKGFRALGASLGPSRRPGHSLYARMAMALGLAPDTPLRGIMDHYLERKEKPIKPTLVKNGPCKENILSGKDVDLLKFPSPLIHGGDGGRYIGTWHTVITKDPDSSWVNWGMYRLMIQDRNTLGCLFPLQQHIGQMYQKCEARNLPLPAAVAIGAQPVVPIVSCVQLPPYVNEADIAGGLQGEPIPLVKCETLDLEVPATAEIVLEGEVLPHERKTEGPFGEYMGYEAGKSSPKPVFRVHAITYRDDPILTFSNMGMPIHESQTVTALIKSAEVYAELRKLGLPIKGVYYPPYAVGHMAVVSTETPFINFAKRVAHSIWATKPGLFTYYIVVVDADVDPTNMDEVLHAVTTKCHPVNGIHPVSHIPGFPVLLPFLPPKERLLGDAAGVIFDCTWPKDWPPESIPVKATLENLWPKEIQEKVLGKWEKYGFKKNESL